MTSTDAPFSSRLPEATAVRSLETGTIMVRPSPSLVRVLETPRLTPNGPFDWQIGDVHTPVEGVDTTGSPRFLGRSTVDNIGTTSGITEDFADISETLSMFDCDWKLVPMDEHYPSGDIFPLRNPALCNKETVGDADNVVSDKKTKKHARHKYDDEIDPNLSSGEKKKQRRILANRASARRSREKKKEAMRYLMQREHQLIQERDAAVVELDDQIRLNFAMRRQIASLQTQLETYQKGKNEGASVVPSEIFGQPTMNFQNSSSSFMLPSMNVQTTNVMDYACPAFDWNCSAGL